jgi:Calcineurin-like phosphoesterase
MSGKLFVQRNWKQAVVLGGAVTLGAGAVPLACSASPSENGGVGQESNSNTPSPDGVGKVGVALTLPGGAVVSSITYDLLSSTGTPVTLLNEPNPGTVSVSNSSTLAFQLGGVPAATNDSISLTASLAGGGTCQGNATGINVAAGGTTNETVQMLCSLPGQDAGNLFITGTASYCGTWTSLSTTSNEVYVGESVVLTASATGPSPSNLGYTWTMSNPIGAFGATSGGVGAPGQDEAVGPSDPMQFMCTAPGTTTITMVVDDGANDAGTCPANLSTLTTTVICDAAPSNQVAAAWVELTGPNGANGLTGNVATARAITEASVAGGANPCPTIAVNSGTPVQMTLRAAGSTSLALRSVNTPPAKPALFPVSSCEFQLPAGATSAVVAGKSLPMPKANPTKIVVIGDTGCRLQNGNGTQSCNDTNPNGTDTPYPFAAVAALAAAQNPDLVLHVGDYAYRDNPCPAGQGYNCGGSPWGFGWDTWQADLFTPGAPLLAAAPWIMTRGNHEQCNRAGQGWYRFLDNNPYDTTGVHTCDNPANDATATGGNWNDPFLVNINSSTQVVVFDTANAKPQSQTPALATGPGSLFFSTYAGELTTAGNLLAASPLPFNLWSNHHPIFAYATGNPPANPIPAFVPVMNSVFPGTYFPAPINLALHGHTHDYQAVNFQTGTLPDGGTFQPAAALVSGNAGDILDTALPYPLTGAALSSVGNPTAVSVATVGGVQQFATSDNGAPFQNPNSSTDNGFGYMVLQFNPGSPATWTSTEYRTDNTVRDVCTIQTSGQMSCASWGVIQPDDAGAY